MPQDFRAKISYIHDVPGSGVRILRVEHADGDLALPEYCAGQYAMLTFPGFSPRPYSIANAPNGKYMEFHIRGTGSGASSYALSQISGGEILPVTAAMGNCVYRPEGGLPLIAVAGGTGLAQMKAILEEALRDFQDREVVLYCGARDKSGLYLDDWFRMVQTENPRFHYIPVLSHEEHTGYRFGLVGDVLAHDRPDLSGCRVYGAGPIEMVRHVMALARERGADPARLHSDTEIESPETFDRGLLR
jgi:NAD(P)H-flavin reductase